MRFFADWSSLRKFNALPEEQRQIVFYAESAADWPHFLPILESLTTTHQRQVTYLTSDPADHVFAVENPRIVPLCIGSGTIRTILFKGLRAKLLVITLPDLGKYNLKRSVYPCHYVYLFHSINSTHMVYRPGAFDEYDTILCVGPHHVREITTTEERYGLKKKRLVPHGYGRLDAIIEQFSDSGPFEPSTGPQKRIVLAPSWGRGSFIEDDCGVPIVLALLEAGHLLTLRLHPMTSRNHPRLGAELERRFHSFAERFSVETNMHDQESLQQADLMISDWSGAALEFAFGLGRPVLFIDMPRKLNNPNYRELELVPFEESIRQQIGAVVSPENTTELLNAVNALCASPGEVGRKITELRHNWIYNIGNSGEVAAETIVKLADEQAEDSTR